MPHATECSTNLINSSSLSSPIQIPNSGSTGYGRSSSSSSYNTSTANTLDDLSDYINNPADNMNVSFDQSYQASSDEGSTYTPTITSDSVARNLQPSYPRDYNCCGTDHLNLHDLLQHVDNSHPGLIVDIANNIIPFEHNSVYSQDRWDLMSPIPVPNVSTSLTTLPLNSLLHEQKSINFNTSTSTPLYSLISYPNNKQKGNVNNNGLGHLNGYNQSGIGQFDRYDQINGQNQDSFTCDNWMNIYQLIYNSNPTNPLRDPNFSSTLFGDQTLSSNPSSISTSLDDDNSLFDIPSKALQLNQDPFSPLLSLSSYPQTPNDYVDSSACLQSVVSSPTSSDNNSVVVSPVTNDQRTTISNSPNINTSIQDNTSQRRSTSTLSLQNTSYGSINTSNSGQGPISSNNDANSSQQKTSYGSVNNNNSRQRPISSPSNDTHVTTQQRRPSSINLSAASHSPTSKLITSVSPTMSNHRHSYGSLPGFLQTSIASNIDSNSASQPRRSSTSTITSSQSTEQYRSINLSNLGQGNISSSGSNVRPVSHIRRSSTSNLTPARPTAQAYSAYMPSVTTTQYSVDGYQIVGHVSPGETSSGAFSAKYHPIQPKAGVAMSDVYTDPALDIKGSKKRTVSTSSVDKSAKRRVTKSSDESISESSVNVLPTDLTSEVENGSEGDIYPYKCAIPGCPKAYKNANGLKYHNEHGHASQSGNGAREKPWACHLGGCLKTYSSKGGLIYHVKRCHPNDLWALP
ncbi:hypothetical protein RhiirA4_473489 [Rhizophagus irregularis]|uniref:C2H2-type domain-containing protein n=1 Tax=Rhizophagus irregularis TaxID=588596 RepID=A0A2I1H6U7_9GLOM|nr:hypothetical protein RhiirA4_473489 [Rhizophagus irregularis]